jgi:hypothetical protein
VQDIIIEELFLPAEPVEYPIWDLIDRNKKNERISEIHFREGFVRMENYNPDFPGLPKELDWKIYIILQRWINIKRCKKLENPGVLKFSLSELRNELGIDKGGQQNRDIIEALYRLYHTNITTNVRLDDEKRYLPNFRLLSVIDPTGGLDQKKEGYQFIVEFPDYFIFKKKKVIDDNKPVICIETVKLDKIKTPLGKLVYSRLQKHIKANTTQFTRTYNFIIDEIFHGFTKRKYLSEMKRQLKPTLEELKHAGVIYDWEIYSGQKWSKNRQRLKQVKEDKVVRIDFILKPKTINKITKWANSRQRKIQEESDTFKKIWDLLSEKEKNIYQTTAIEEARKHSGHDDDSPLFKGFVHSELKKLILAKYS